MDGTPFDFRDPVRVGARIDADDPQLHLARGYDQTFVFGPTPAGTPCLNASVFDPESGRILEVWSTQPGLQF